MENNMTNNDLLNQPTDELINRESTKETAIIAYIVISTFSIMILLIFACVKQKEVDLLRGKAHHDSLVNKRLNDNLLMPR